MARLQPMATRRRPAPVPAEGPPARSLPLPALAVTVGVVALALAGGVGLDTIASPQPTGAFASCPTAPRIGAELYGAPPPMCIDPNATYVATVDTSKGSFKITMVARDSPLVVNNFIVLAAHGYYNGLHFFNSQSWVIQSGDPLGDGSGGPGYTLPAVRPLGGQKWTSGAVGMARFPDGRISGSQFFVLRAAWPAGGPKGTYDRLGTVTSGSLVVSSLENGDHIISVQITRKS
jgi:peptidylprolyl isomerase